MPLFYAPYLTAAKVRLFQDTPTSRQAAAGLLGRLLESAEAAHNTRLLIEVLAVEALLHDVQGDQDAALATLERAIMLAQTSGFIRLFADLGSRMGSLLIRLSDRSAAPDFVRQILAVIAQARPVVTSTNQDGLIERLTERELEVLSLLERRLSDKEIAQLLTISLGTVKRHTHSIFEKLYAGNRREAVAKATAIGILPL